jgi:hypothetical protein
MVAKYKVKEKQKKVKNLLLPRQRHQKTFFMAATLFFKCSSLGIQVQSVFFPHKGESCVPSQHSSGNMQ